MTINLAEAPDNLWDVLTGAIYSRTLIGCQTHCGVRLGCALAGQRPPPLPFPSPTSCCSCLSVCPGLPQFPHRVLMFKLNEQS